MSRSIHIGMIKALLLKNKKKTRWWQRNIGSESTTKISRNHDPSGCTHNHHTLLWTGTAR